MSETLLKISLTIEKHFYQANNADISCGWLLLDSAVDTCTHYLPIFVYSYSFKIPN